MSFQSPYAAQVPLPFFGPYGDPQSFELYFPGANREAYQCLLELCDTASPLSLYLWGGPGSGKSHLLQATCQRFYERGRQAAYLPLSQIPEWSPAVLEGLESLDLVGLDEIDCVAGRSEWELALLHLYNRLGDSARPLIMAGRIHPQGLSIKRADLKSRLLGSLVFHLQGLNDEAKVMSLQQRAGARGFELPLEVARYLLKHYPRDMKALCCLLDTLDRASLVAQRRLTIPFVRALLES